MGPSNCAVVGCRNNSYQLMLWKKRICELHKNIVHAECGCRPPFRLFCFPSKNRYKDQRERWIKMMRRIENDRTIWHPKPSDRVCSDHFISGEPTATNPDPTLQLGYDKPSVKPRRTLFRESSGISKKNEGMSPIETTYSLPAACAHGSKKRVVAGSVIEEPAGDPACSLSTVAGTTFSTEQGSSFSMPVNDNIETLLHIPSCNCSCCQDKNAVIDKLYQQVQYLQMKNNKLTQDISSKSVFSWQKIKTDKKMNFYTGISSIQAFLAVYKLIQPYLCKVQYWRGSKRVISTRKRSFTRSKVKKLSYKNELLLTLMRIRLGLLNEDLADRFGISSTVCSNTFKTWIRLLRILLGDALVKWLPVEAIRDNMPTAYRRAGHGNLRCIIDCTEVFIEQPKGLDVQAQTWSDYKSHNTIKFLIGIAPTGYITFLSDCYSGRASDKHICNDSGFFDLLERGDEIMADRGFQITEELLLRFCSLSVPPGARTKAQMTEEECKKTTDIANLRIHVERAINRIKTFRILKSVLPITMLHHADDIVHTCAALCNLKPFLIKPRKPGKGKLD